MAASSSPVKTKRAAAKNGEDESKRRFFSTTEANQEEGQVLDWMLAKQGIRLFINNKGEEAEKLFLEHTSSLQMYSGYSFAVFMDALMSFEEDKLTLATSVLKELETRCVASQSGFFKSVKRAFSYQSQQSATENTAAMFPKSKADILETQIILADSHVCLAFLTFLQQEMSAYLKAGWILRKAWKVYQSTYNEILSLYNQIMSDSAADTPSQNAIPTSSSGTHRNSFVEFTTASLFPPPLPTNGGYNLKLSNNNNNNNNNTMPHSKSVDLSQDFFSRKNDGVTKSFSVNSDLKSSAGGSSSYWSTKFSSLTQSSSSLSLNSFTNSIIERLLRNQTPSNNNYDSTIDKDTIKRLMGAISFGYGLFQLGVSLLPQSLLKLTNFLGFAGNRQNGLACLMYARHGEDMRAPLATLSLLWYHTIVRPFYGIDGINVRIGAEEASQLLQESDKEYAQSALFLFFRGRVNRLQGDISEALRSFQAAVENGTQREMKLLAMHEVAWCHMIKLDHCAAEATWAYLRTSSRWSRPFYTYLAGICSGSCDVTTFTGHVLSDIRKGRRSGTHLDEFLNRRARVCEAALVSGPNLSTCSSMSLVVEPPTIACRFYKLLVYEMLYLWNAIPNCSTEGLEKIIEGLPNGGNCTGEQKIEKIFADCRSSGNNNNNCINEPMTGLSNLILGVGYDNLGHIDKAIDSFRTCIARRKHLPFNADDGHISAFSHYELGSLLIRSPETRDEGKLVLEKVANFKEYDFEYRLTVRVHGLLKNL